MIGRSHAWPGRRGGSRGIFAREAYRVGDHKQQWLSGWDIGAVGCRNLYIPGLEPSCQEGGFGIQARRFGFVERLKGLLE